MIFSMFFITHATIFTIIIIVIISLVAPLCLSRFSLHFFTKFYFFLSHDQSLTFLYSFIYRIQGCAHYCKNCLKKEITSLNFKWLIWLSQPAWQAFEREGKGSFRRERNTRGARGRREGNACQETIAFFDINIYQANVKILIGQNLIRSKQRVLIGHLHDIQ